MKNSENWIKIEKNIFEKSDFKDINFIIQILQWSPTPSIKRYNFFINSSIDDLEKSSNFQQLSSIDKEYVRIQTYDAFISGKNSNYKYIISNKSSRLDKEFNIQEAIRYFLSPVSIIIENSLNDSYFLNSIFKHFEPKVNQERKLLSFLNNDWIQYVNAGGWSNIKNYINGRQKSLESFANRHSRKPQDFLRCFVLMDSDKLHSGDQKADKEKLKIELEELGIEVHILDKRAMENYMPQEVLENLPSINRRYSVYKNWIKKYKNYSAEDIDFLNYKDELDNFSNFKDEFPKFFEIQHLCYKKTLLAREGGLSESNEFLDIIDKVNSLL